MRKALTRPTFLVIIFSLSLLSAFAQEEEEPPGKPSGNASQVYVEAGGPGFAYSLNYDGRFGRKDKGIGFRVGASAIYVDGSGAFTFPIGLNYLIGRQGNYFEVGAGATLATSEDVFDTESGKMTWGFVSFGYRRQAYRKQGITWRVAFNPIFGDGFFIPWFGASIGYRF